MLCSFLCIYQGSSTFYLAHYRWYPLTHSCRLNKLNLERLFLYSYYFSFVVSGSWYPFAWVWAHGQKCMPPQACGGQKTACRSHFSPSTIWIPECWIRVDMLGRQQVSFLLTHSASLVRKCFETMLTHWPSQTFNPIFIIFVRNLFIGYHLLM